MRNDIFGLRRGGHALRGDADAVDDRTVVTADDLKIAGNTGFAAVSTVLAVGSQWTSHLGSIGRQLRGLGDTVTLAAVDLVGTDDDNGRRITAAGPIIEI